jgi:hypothetical protein
VKCPLFNSLAALSLALFIATIALWVRSYRVRDAAPGSLSNTGLQIISSRGRLVVLRATLIQSPTPSTARAIIVRNFLVLACTGDQLLNVPALSNGYGFGHASTEGNHSVNGRIVVGYRFDLLAVPYWSVIFLLAIIPALAINRSRSAHFRTKGHCPTCGYDIRATPERCPECWTISRGTPVVDIHG